MTDQEQDDNVKLEDPLMKEEEEEEEEEEKSNSCCKCVCCFLFLLLLIAAIGVGVYFLYVIYLKKPKQDDKTAKWEESYRKAKEFVSKLNRTEKVNILFGTENMRFLNRSMVNTTSELDQLCVGQIDAFKNDKVSFKGMCLQDGPAGVRFTQGTSISWQSNLNMASTFNKTLLYEVGKAQGEENKEKGINTFLSPCVNIMRTPQAGRVWEAFGEDPFYSGVCATEMIKGIQDAGVIATIKHFIGNEQETYRHASSSNIDKSPLMDIYVEPFYRAIHDANVGALMSGYNAVNNTYCSENKALLTDILRDILDFKGFVMSDWWAIYNDHIDNFNSGLDMNMPGGKGYGNYYTRQDSYWSNLEELADAGNTTDKRIEESATRIIASMYQMDQMDNFPDIHLYKNTITEERKKLQRKAAAESQILLKNKDNILPLKDNISIAVIGNDAVERDCGEDKDMSCRNDTNEVSFGHIPLGYGSGTTTFKYLITPLQGITELAEKKNISVESSCELLFTDVKRGSKTVHVKGEENIDKAVEVAKKVDVAIVFVKADSGEEYITVENSIGDRENLDLWHNANELVEKVAEVNENIIVVINAPAVVNLPWLDKVKGVIFSGFPGAESGHAIADILFGEVFPSGHLPYAWGGIDDYGVKIEHLTNYTKCETGKSYKDEYRYDGIDGGRKDDTRPGHDKEQYDYKEGLYVGQRWFNKQKKKPLFPFGFGLTYTTFEYSGLEVKMAKDGLTAKFKVKNAGKYSGSAVPMMFLTFPDSIGDYPKYIFKGFEKVEIGVGEEKEVTITADEHALSYFNVEQNKYVRVNNGTIKVYIAENGDPDQAKLNTEINSEP
jgi:beta-glucosidase